MYFCKSICLEVSLARELQVLQNCGTIFRKFLSASLDEGLSKATGFVRFPKTQDLSRDKRSIERKGFYPSHIVHITRKGRFGYMRNGRACARGSCSMHDFDSSLLLLPQNPSQSGKDN